MFQTYHPLPCQSMSSPHDFWPPCPMSHAGHYHHLLSTLIAIAVSGLSSADLINSSRAARYTTFVPKCIQDPLFSLFFRCIFQPPCQLYACLLVQSAVCYFNFSNRYLLSGLSSADLMNNAICSTVLQPCAPWSAACWVWWRVGVSVGDGIGRRCWGYGVIVRPNHWRAGGTLRTRLVLLSVELELKTWRRAPFQNNLHWLFFIW